MCLLAGTRENRPRICEPLLPAKREFIVQHEKDSISPSETNLVGGIPEFQFTGDIGPSGDYVIFLVDGLAGGEVAEEHGEKFYADAICVCVETVAPQALNHQQLGGRPAERRIPLIAGLAIAGLESTRTFEFGQVGRHAGGLLLGGDPGP